MAFLTAEQFRALDDRKKDTVAVPEWGCEVVVASMGAKDRQHYVDLVAQYRDGDKSIDLVSFVVAACLCDGDGKRLCDPYNPDDIAQVAGRDPEALGRIFMKGLEVSVLTTKAAEEQAKNS